MTSNEIMILANKILYHKRKYYDGEPEISDEAYDSLEEKLRKLDPVNPVLFIVGTPEGGKITHDVPMLSCQKALDVEEVLKWSQGYDLFIEYKIDGLSLSLTYNEGRLVQAATRGNGVTGDDTTIVAMKLKSIPKTIPVRERIFIRGEIFMSLSEFHRINALGTESYSSPRNLAVGTIKQKDLSLLDKRKLEFF
ncbi:MAG: NAD-dependent DNA ligase LigA, partial [Candidatus Heimdallarchaeota archaeon]|nr:NAD-dependent DNA ligase LigA [Candidatus Heimdallarchaeota archaeon]